MVTLPCYVRVLVRGLRVVVCEDDGILVGVGFIGDWLVGVVFAGKVGTVSLFGLTDQF